MSLGRKLRRLIDNATAADVDKLVSRDSWSVKALERLSKRVEQAAHDDPPNGYALALYGLAFLANRLEYVDLEARAYTSAGAAARRLGRLNEAAAHYSRAKKLARNPRTLARLHLCIAVLAREEARFTDAFSAVDLAERYGASVADVPPLVAAIRGSIFVERGERNSSTSDFGEAIRWLTTAASTASPGSTAQALALLALATVMTNPASPRFGPAHVRPVLQAIRESSRGTRSIARRRCRAFADWIDGRLCIRLGSTRQGVRLMRKAGQTLARAGHHGEALRIAVDIAELGIAAGGGDEATDYVADVVVLIPRDSPFADVADLFRDLEPDALSSSNWAADVRAAIEATS